MAVTLCRDLDSAVSSRTMEKRQPFAKFTVVKEYHNNMRSLPLEVEQIEHSLLETIGNKISRDFEIVVNQRCPTQILKRTMPKLHVGLTASNQYFMRTH